MDALSGAALGRSHRSKLGKGKLKEVIDRTRATLEVPDSHLVGIVPASDTGAVEMAMWSMLGERPVDCFFWESFGKGWAGDLKNELQVPELHVHEADYGHIADLSQARPEHDLVFTANGTTSGVRVPEDGWDFISPDRTGISICDATSAVYAQRMPWELLDVTTFSWQKVLGGEGAHGIIVLSPRAVERLESYTPTRPLPKIFRMVKKGAVDAALFEGSTINTPSMLAVEDAIDALKWVEGVGGLDATIARSDANLAVLTDFVERHDWIHFLAKNERERSNTSICFTLDLDEAQVKAFTSLLEAEGAAYDIGAYRDAPDGLRIWGGATVEESDLAALLPWLEYAVEQVRA